MSQTANLTVLATFSCPTITLSPATLPNGKAGAPYSQTITQSGGVGTTTFAVTAGTLPTGLTLSTGGVLSGTPNVTGASTFTVTATDSNGCTGSQDYTLTIGCGAITLSPASLPNGTAGAPYSQAITEIGGVGTVTFSVTAGALQPASPSPQVEFSPAHPQRQAPLPLR